MAWLYLCGAIVSEVLGTSFLKASDGFSKLGPSLIALAGYGAALFLLSLAVRQIEVGTAYAIGAGVGRALIAMIGWLVFHQKLDWAAVVRLVMIVGGIAVIKIFSDLSA